jgi:hypothetical protein
MKRREFIAALGGGAAWPLLATGQQPAKIPVIGILRGARRYNKKFKANFAPVAISARRLWPLSANNLQACDEGHIAEGWRDGTL